MTFDVECRPAFDYARKEHYVTVGDGGAFFASKARPTSPSGSTGVPLKERPKGAAGGVLR